MSDPAIEMPEFSALTPLEYRLIRDELSRLVWHRGKGREGPARRVERRLAKILGEYCPGRVFAFCGFAWTVDETTPRGKIRVIPLDELDS